MVRTTNTTAWPLQGGKQDGYTSPAGQQTGQVSSKGLNSTHRQPANRLTALASSHPPIRSCVLKHLLSQTTEPHLTETWRYSRARVIAPRTYRCSVTHCWRTVVPGVKSASGYAAAVYAVVTSLSGLMPGVSSGMCSLHQFSSSVCQPKQRKTTVK